jgi:hypothetical protein
MTSPVTKEPRGVLATPVVLAGLTIAVLAPFLGKAFHMDDPLFIWTAKHLRRCTLRLLRLRRQLGRHACPDVVVTQNPRSRAYYMALVGAIAGWSEAACMPASFCRQSASSRYRPARTAVRRRSLACRR